MYQLFHVDSQTTLAALKMNNKQVSDACWTGQALLTRYRLQRKEEQYGSNYISTINITNTAMII